MSTTRFRRSAFARANNPFRATEILVTCPCCGTPNFSTRGLRAHQCGAKPDRARLTPAELALAKPSAA